MQMYNMTSDVTRENNIFDHFKIEHEKYLTKN